MLDLLQYTYRVVCTPNIRCSYYASLYITRWHKRFNFTFQQSSAIFTATKNVQETYDAYEKDIAIVSFYFKQPTAFEYTR